jgi:hypothetical protein
MSNRKRFAEALEFSQSVLRGSAFLFVLSASTATPLFLLNGLSFFAQRHGSVVQASSIQSACYDTNFCCMQTPAGYDPTQHQE